MVQLQSFNATIIKNKNMTLPQKFLNTLTQNFPNESSDITELFKRRPTTFRVNTIKANPEQTIESLQDQDFELQESTSIPNAFILKNKSKKDLIQTQEYQEGAIYLQSLASQLPVVILDPKPEDKVLDITAAPGGKTSQVAALMNQKGELQASDISNVRFQKLKHNLQKLGIETEESNFLTLHHKRGEDLCQELPENSFNKILLDAPCSGESRFITDYPKSYKYWSPENLPKLHQRQLSLLQASWKVLQAEGELVYSTCTMNTLENEEVIQAFLKANPDAELQEIQIPNLQKLSTPKQFIKSPDLSKTFRIYPDETIESFFIAKLKKCTK